MQNLVYVVTTLQNWYKSSHNVKNWSLLPGYTEAVGSYSSTDIHSRADRLRLNLYWRLSLNKIDKPQSGQS